MKKPLLFGKFADPQQDQYEKELYKKYDPEIVRASIRKWKNYTNKEKEQIGEEGNCIYQDFVLTIPKGPASQEAQNCVVRWRKHMEYFWSPNDEQLLEIAKGYHDDPRFKANFDKIHPDLAVFIRDSVEVYLRES